MPFIIWGWRGVPSQLDAGEFFCPQCNRECEYRLMQSRTFFTIFFLPIIPLGRGERYVECTQCRQTYQEGVLAMTSASAEDRFLGQLVEELNTGTSLELAQRKLETAGIAPDHAQQFLDQLSEGKTWRCDGCGDHYLKVVSQCLRCKP